MCHTDACLLSIIDTIKDKCDHVLCVNFESVYESEILSYLM